jgi:hypothetical protein
VLARPRARSTIEINSKNSLYSHSHFTEHLVGAFGKSPRKSNLNHKSSSLLIRRLKNNIGFTLQQSWLNRRIESLEHNNTQAGARSDIHNWTARTKSRLTISDCTGPKLLAWTHHFASRNQQERKPTEQPWELTQNWKRQEKIQRQWRDRSSTGTMSYSANANQLGRKDSCSRMTTGTPDRSKQH